MFFLIYALFRKHACKCINKKFYEPFLLKSQIQKKLVKIDPVKTKYVLVFIRSFYLGPKKYFETFTKVCKIKFAVKNTVQVCTRTN